VILGGGVAVCLLLSAHRAVIFAIAQLSCSVRKVRVQYTANHYANTRGICFSRGHSSVSVPLYFMAVSR